MLQDIASPKLPEQTRHAIRGQCEACRQVNISMIWLGRWLWVNVELTLTDDD